MTVENTGENAFILEGGTYYSNNHMDSSSSAFSVSAQYACTLTLQYGVSSETYCDNLRIVHNGITLDEISGEMDGKTLTEEQWTALGDLTPENILDYVLGRYELPTH